MAFFPEITWQPDEYVDDVLRERPSYYVGGVVAVEFVVARSTSAVVAVQHMAANPDGFSFELCTYLQDPVTDRHPGYGQPGFDDPNTMLRVGLVFPDGTEARDWSFDDPYVPPRYGFLGHGDATHGLQTSGASADGWSSQGRHSAWPVPTNGVLTFVVRWRAQGIEETRYELDAALLGEAASRAIAV